MKEHSILIEAFQSSIQPGAITVTVLRLDRPPSPERYYHRVTAASLRRLTRLLDKQRYTTSICLEPWHSCLGWRAYIRTQL